MAFIASSMGFSTRPCSVTTERSRTAHVELRPGRWVAIVLNDDTIAERPVDAGWIIAARTAGEVALTLAYDDLPEGKDVNSHTDGHVVLGLLDVREDSAPER